MLVIVLLAGIFANINTELYKAPDIGGYKILITADSDEGDISADTSALEDKFNVLGQSTSSSTSINIINGNMKKTSTTTLSISIVPTTNTDTVPSITVQVGSNTYHTPVLKLSEAKQSSSSGFGGFFNNNMFGNNFFKGFGINNNDISVSSGDIVLKAVVNKREVFVGEQLVVSFYLYKRQGINFSDLSLAREPSFKGFIKENLETVKQLNFDAQQSIGGKTYQRALIAKYLLYPVKDGTLNIDPLILNLSVGGMGFFSMPRQFRRATKNIAITVKPLPQNAPLGFSGAVGEFDAKLSLDKSTVKVGQNATVVVTVTGRGNFDLVDLSKLIKFDDSFSVFNSKGTLKKNKFGVGQKQFQFVIVPQKGGSYTLGPWNFVYFDTKTAQYASKTLGPVKLSVVASGIAVNKTNKQQTPMSSKPKDYIDTLTANSMFSVKSLIFSPYPWLILAFILLLILIIFISKRTNSRKETIKLLKRKLATVQRELETANIQTALSLMIDSLKLIVVLLAKVDTDTSSHTVLELIDDNSDRLDNLDDLKDLAVKLNSMKFSGNKKQEDLIELADKLKKYLVKLKK